MIKEHRDFIDSIIYNGLTLKSAKRICREIKASIATLEADLARKQRAIDAAMSARRSGMNAGSIADILRPEATDAKLNEAGVTYTPTKPQRPLPKREPLDDDSDAFELPPIGVHHPDDPLQTEWTDDGFRITKQPEEWRDWLDETHGDIHVKSSLWPDWYGRECLRLRGACVEADNSLVRVQNFDKPRVWAAICSLNAKHRKPQNSMSKPIAEAFDDMVAILRGDADEATKRSAFDTLEEIVFPSVLGDVVFEPQPDQPDTGFGTHVVPEYKPSAQPEPSGDSIAKRVDALERLTQELASAHCATFPPDQRIVGLVKRLADPVLRCCLQLNNEYKARDFVGTHAERSLLCNAIDECQAIIAELSAAEARLFSMRLPFHPEAKRDA